MLKYLYVYSYCKEGQLVFYLGRYLCAVIGKFLTALLHPRYLLHSYEFKIEIISYSLAQGFGSFLKLFCFYFFRCMAPSFLAGMGIP